MNSNLQFDFLTNKENNTLTINREFNVNRQLVWDCFTKQDLLDQWYAPAPFTSKTKSMDFRNGGHWHYAMVDPNGNEFWSWTEFSNILPIDSYETLDSFCNEKGDINFDFPRAKRKVTFLDKDGNSVVQIVIYYASLTDLETVINMGMKEGMVVILEKLDQILLTINK